MLRNTLPVSSQSSHDSRILLYRAFRRNACNPGNTKRLTRSWFGLAQAKFYRKLWERMESEKGILAYLQAQVIAAYRMLLYFVSSCTRAVVLLSSFNPRVVSRPYAACDPVSLQLLPHATAL